MRFTLAGDAFALKSGDEITAIAMRPEGERLFVAVTKLGSSWISSDGVTWRAGGDLAFKKGLIARQVRDLMFSDGRFVAVGRESTLTDNALTQGLMWTSIDGSTWTSARLGYAEIRALAANTEPLVGAGADEFGGGLAKLDGLKWTIDRPDSPLTAIGIGRPNDVLAVEGGYLLVGDSGSFSAAPAPRVAIVSFANEWHWLTNGAPTGPVLDQVTYAPDGFAALAADGVLWTANEVTEWSGPVTLPFRAGGLFDGPDGSLLGMGDGIWAETSAGAWTRVDDGTAPDGTWAYAEGIAIGCEGTTCHVYRASTPAG